MSSLLYLGSIALLLYAFKKAYIIVIRPALSPVSRLPGPSRPSFLWGCMGTIFKNKPGMWHIAMIEKYGKTFSYKGFMNTNRLCTVDPTALLHILSRTDIYEKPDQVRRGLGRILGQGLLFSEGDAHRRQRKIMNPSFSAGHIRTLVPIMYMKTQQARDIWLTAISSDSDSVKAGKPPAPVNVLNVLARMALDIIGITGFDYPFDALDGGHDSAEVGDEVAQAFSTVLYQPPGYGWWNIIINWFPILYKFPTTSERRIQHAVDTLQRLGTQMVAARKAAIVTEMSPSERTPQIDVGKHSLEAKDFLTLLIRANMAHDLSPSERLSDGEMMSQISTFVTAGHETSAISLCWALHTLARYPQVQHKLREEILNVSSEEPSLDILDGLPYLDAVVKETLRWVSVLPNSIRICTKNDTIPIENGTKAIEIKAGDGIYIPIVALNKLGDVWGDDACEFRPERWLNPMSDELKAKQKHIPSVFGSLMTFTGGPRSCIGWKFAVIEMKCALFTFIRSLSFSLPPGQEITESRTAIISRPLVKGRENEGNMLPLLVERIG